MTGAHFGRRGNFNLKHSHCLVFRESQLVSFPQSFRLFHSYVCGDRREIEEQHKALQPNTCILTLSFCPTNILKQE